MDKQLLTALANKIYSRLQEIYKRKHKEFTDNYIPSDDYKRLSVMKVQLDEIQSQMRDLDEQKEKIFDDVRSICGIRSVCDIYSNEMFRILKETEFKFKVPQIQEIKDDIILYCVDGDSNSVIDELVERYEHQGND